MTKKELVAKIAKEQNLDPKKLERLNMEELTKMDAVVADVEEFPEVEEVSSEEIQTELPSDVEVGAGAEEAPLAEPDKSGTYLGLNPITLEKVYL